MGDSGTPRPVAAVLREANVEGVLLIDGDCGLCNATVRWLAERGLEGIAVVAQQSQIGAALLGPVPTSGASLDTVVLIEASGQTEQSTAVFKVLGHVGGFWKASSRVGAFVPKVLRDRAYRLVASNRKRLSHHDSCAIPTATLKAWNRRNEAAEDRLRTALGLSAA